MSLYFFWNVIAFVITIGILITVHEFGHFCAARFFGVQVERLSIGFGPVLWGWKSSKGTEYVISSIPLGGYVKLLDSSSCNKKNNQQNFINNSIYSKDLWKRGIIILSGPIFNFIFSILSYVLVYTIGIPVYKPVINYILPGSIIDKINIPIGSEIKYINNIQVTNWDAVRFNILNSIKSKEKSAISMQCMHSNSTQIVTYTIYPSLNWLNFDAIDKVDLILELGMLPYVLTVTSAQSGVELYCSSKQNLLRINDQILLINKQPLYNWELLIKNIKNNPEKEYLVTIIRDKCLLNLNILLGDKNLISSQSEKKNINFYLKSNSFSGIKNPEICKYNLCTIILKSFYKTCHLIYHTIVALFKVIIGDIQIFDLHGPIAIAQGARYSMYSGFIYYLAFLAVISVNLGVINLFPFPILDGGQLFLLLIEKIKGSSLSQQTVNFVYLISFLMLSLLMLLALYNDIIKSK